MAHIVLLFSPVIRWIVWKAVVILVSHVEVLCLADSLQVLSVYAHSGLLLYRRAQLSQDRGVFVMKT